MTIDVAFHYPPDVFDAVVDAVPLLTRGKHDVTLFFRGCGVDRAFLARIDKRIDEEPRFSKYHISREILAHVNELGDPGLGQRRQILMRLSEFDEFSSCYPDNQMKARGAVATVAQLVNKKDSFTRLQDEREQDLKRHRDAQRAEAARKEAGRKHREQVKADPFALFGQQDPHRRGKALEGVLNRLFETEHILVRVYSRGQVGGILISNSPYHPSAVADCRDALKTKTVVLVELREIIQALTLDRPVRELLVAKIRAAALLKDPLVFPLEDVA
jgi:hypothetical protein